MWTVVRNAIANGATFAINIGIAFLLTPFIIAHLGQTAFGMWGLVIALTGYLGLLDLGTRSAIPKFVAEHRARGDADGLNRFASTMQTISLVLGALALLGTGVLAYFSESFFWQAEPEVRDLLPYLVLIVGANITLTFAFITFQGVLFGCQRYTIVNTIGLTMIVVRSLLTWWLLAIGYGVITLGLIMTGCSAVTWLLNMWLAYRAAPGLKISIGRIDRTEFKKITTFSFTSLLINVGDALIYWSASVILGYSRGFKIVALFVIAENLVIQLREVVLVIVSVLVPAASELEARQETEKLQGLTVYSTKAVLLMLLPIGLGILFAGRAFLHLWMGDELSPDAIRTTSIVLSILVTSQVLALSQYGPEQILYGIAKHKALAYLLVTIAVVDVALGLILVRSHGIYGVAIGCAVPLALGQTIFVPIFIRRYVGLPVTDYLRRAVVPVLAPALIFGLTLYGLVHLWPPERGWIWFCLDIGLSLLVYAPAIYLLGCSQSERAAIRTFAASRLKG